jgi:phosphoglycolate phosphatase
VPDQASPAALASTGPLVVVFDLDNTLVHSRIDFLGIRQAIIARLLESGVLAAPPADPRARAIPEWLELAEHHDRRLSAELWQLVDQYEREGMLVGTVEDDARPVLDCLRRSGVRLGVLTNNSLSSAEAALERFDLRAPLELVLARQTVPALKPSGMGVRQAHLALGGGPTFVVGDSYIDGQAAERAQVGARFVAFRANLADLAARGVEPWAVTTQLDQVPPLVLAAAAQMPTT